MGIAMLSLFPFGLRSPSLATWVVELTFAWLMRYRRLVRDYEKRLDVSEAMIYITLGSSVTEQNDFPVIF